MSVVIALAGKGGTGKTTLAALIIRHLKAEADGAILAVDADPTSGLAQGLGIMIPVTIGSMRETFLKDHGDLPTGVPKETYLELKTHELLAESEGVDLLVMGRPEGKGCYCYINNVLRGCIDLLVKNYAYVVIDNEAGMEHLSRRTTHHVDVLLITTDHSINGLRAAKKVGDLATEMGLSPKGQYVVANRVTPNLSGQFLDEADRLGIVISGAIPEDPMILEYDLAQRPLIQLPERSAAVRSMSEIVKWVMV